MVYDKKGRVVSGDGMEFYVLDIYQWTEDSNVIMIYIFLPDLLVKTLRHSRDNFFW